VSAVSDPVRVRFAPSPTGSTHLGNLRTALFDWLLARRTGGRFILRIEDTDQGRFTPGAVEQLQDDMRWLGLDWDEGPDVGGPYGPYIQSQRLDLYHKATERLLAEGRAYYCDCSPERLERVRQEQLARGENPHYDNFCRSRNVPPGENTVVRLHLPDEGLVTFHDAVYGEVSFDNTTLEDLILLKSDGFPTYHLANVVDDHAMAISLVLRGNEWLSSVPWHIHLYAAFGWEPPEYAHLPLIVDIEGRKLKKRLDEIDGVTNTYLEYARMFRVHTLRQKGYLPDAVLNYLAFLGWNPGTTEEIFTPDEIIARFSLDRVSASPSAFDVDRLDWFNRQHLARLTSAERVNLVLPYLRRAYPDDNRFSDSAWVALLVETASDGLTTLQDIVPSTQFIFEAPTNFTGEAKEVLESPSAAPVLVEFLAALPAQNRISLNDAKVLLNKLSQHFKREYGWSGRQVYFPLRSALMGEVHGPPVANIVALLGVDACRCRVQQVTKNLGG
jgi:glutamyl-tRNA synthetase